MDGKMGMYLTEAVAKENGLALIFTLFFTIVYWPRYSNETEDLLIIFSLTSLVKDCNLYVGTVFCLEANAHTDMVAVVKVNINSETPSRGIKIVYILS